MMEWYQIAFDSLTNGIRVFMCLFLVATLQKWEKPSKGAVGLSLICGVVTAVLLILPLPQIVAMTFEVLAILLILYRKHPCEIRMCAFLTVYFEIAAALWDFLISAGLEIFFRHSAPGTILGKDMVSVWIVRVLMVGLMSFVVLRGDRAGKTLERVGSAAAVAGMLCVVILTEQSVVPLPDDQLMTWMILSTILFVAVLIYRINRQYEMERAIAQLEKEKNALFERDYQALSDTYAANAKLFHDFHNHIDALHRYLTKGSAEEAISYLEGLRSPIQAFANTAWMGEEAVDYLINSKIALAGSRQIQTNIDIEFPRHTNIRSVDLVTILGNLLDNALDAAGNAETGLRFVNLTIRRINDMLVIKVENGCCAAPDMIDGELQTSKTDKALHGWGLRSARTAAEHYDGTIETEYSGHTFRAVAILSFEAVKFFANLPEPLE